MPDRIPTTELFATCQQQFVSNTTRERGHVRLSQLMSGAGELDEHVTVFVGEVVEQFRVPVNP